MRMVKPNLAPVNQIQEKEAEEIEMLIKMLIGLLLVAAYLLLAFYRAKGTYYICPHCGAKFNENTIATMFTVRTFIRRMITCPRCGHIDEMRPRFGKIRR